MKFYLELTNFLVATPQLRHTATIMRNIQIDDEVDDQIIILSIIGGYFAGRSSTHVQCELISTVIYLKKRHNGRL